MAQAPAEARPLFEAGMLGAGGIFPDYPASNQSHFHALPIPYLIYRGRYLQLAPTSARGVFFSTPAVSLDVSASGAFRTSHEDRARAGMPGLDYLGEVGPRLNLLLAHDAADAKLDLELALRAVFSTDFSRLDYRGLVLAPELADTHSNFMGSGGQLKVGIGADFASGRLMQYFYTVAPQFAIPGRPAFEAQGGYLGTHLDVSYRYPLNRRVTVIGFSDASLYSGASNAASPLFKRQYGVAAGVAVAFSFFESETTTETPAEE
ncbi:MAG: MipA/OmpV family protein [Stellaceae bacterium]